MANTVAYGFIEIQDIFSKRAKEVGVEVISKAMDETIAEWNRQVAALMTWVEPTTVIKQKVDLASTSRMQMVSEHGVPDLVRRPGQYEVGFPIREWATAIGGTRRSWPTMTVAELNKEVMSALSADSLSLRTHLLATIFTNTTWVFNDDFLGNVNITPLANGDSVVYTKNGNSAPSIDNHYLAQAAAISDAANPYETIYNELIEHPTNAGSTIVAYIPTNLATTTKALTDFVEVQDPLIQYGANANTLTAAAMAEMDSIRGAGNEVLGRVNKIWIVQWDALPDSYIIAVSLNADAPVKMRESDVPELQGLYKTEHPTQNDGMVWRWYRMSGFGIYDRTAMVVYRIGNASYAIPTGYAQPLANG